MKTNYIKASIENAEAYRIYEVIEHLIPELIYHGVNVKSIIIRADRLNNEHDVDGLMNLLMEVSHEH